MNAFFSTYNKNIQVVSEIDDIELAIVIAVPVGLILCELLSNAYKHAFKEVDKGAIHIQLKRSDEDQNIIHMKIWDDGIGYSGENALLEQTSTGVEIISSFIEQLNASYTYLSLQKGFGIFITFSTKEN